MVLEGMVKFLGSWFRFPEINPKFQKGTPEYSGAWTVAVVFWLLKLVVAVLWGIWIVQLLL